MSPVINRRNCCVGMGIGLILLVALIVLTPFYAFFLSPEQESIVAKSPDGRFTAHVGMRGFVDSLNGHLYIRERGGRLSHSVRVWRLPERVNWRSDSQAIAFATWDALYAYDLPSRRLGQVDLKLPSGVGRCSAAKWLGPHTIVVLASDRPITGSPDLDIPEDIRRAAVFNIRPKGLNELELTPVSAVPGRSNDRTGVQVPQE